MSRLADRLRQASGEAEAQRICDRLAPLELAVTEDRELVAGATVVVASLERVVGGHLAAALAAAQEEKDS